MYSGNQQLINMRDTINDMRPVSLATLVVVDSFNYSHSVNPFEDSFGYRHHETFRFNPGHAFDYARGDNSFAVYNLAGRYTHFSAEIVAESGIRSDVTFLIEITLDDNVTPVAVVEGFNIVTGATLIEADISGATTMVITVRAATGRNRAGRSPIRLVNAVLER